MRLRCCDHGSGRCWCHRWQPARCSHDRSHGARKDNPARCSQGWPCSLLNIFSVVPQAPMGCMMPILIITVASSKTSMPRISTIAHFSPCKYVQYSIRNEVVECNRHHGFLGPTAPSAFYNVYRSRLSRLMSCFDFLHASPDRLGT